MNSSSTGGQTATPESNSPPPTLSQTTVTLPLTLVAGLLETAGQYVNLQRENKGWVEKCHMQREQLQAAHNHVTECGKMLDRAHAEIVELQRCNVEKSEEISELNRRIEAFKDQPRVSRKFSEEEVEQVQQVASCGKTRARAALRKAGGEVREAVKIILDWKKRD